MPVLLGGIVSRSGERHQFRHDLGRRGLALDLGPGAPGGSGPSCSICSAVEATTTSTPSSAMASMTARYGWAAAPPRASAAVWPQVTHTRGRSRGSRTHSGALPAPLYGT